MAEQLNTAEDLKLYSQRSIQGKILKEHKENNKPFFSGWKAAGIGIISLAIIIVCIFGFVSIEIDAVLSKLNE